MNILEFCEKALDHQVKTEGGAAENLEYLSRRGRKRIDTRGFVSYGTYERDKGHKDHREDYLKFSSVILEMQPSRRDAIIYNGETYLVDSWRAVKQYSNQYDIVGIAHQARKGNLEKNS